MKNSGSAAIAWPDKAQKKQILRTNNNANAQAASPLEVNIVKNINPAMGKVVPEKLPFTMGPIPMAIVAIASPPITNGEGLRWNMLVLLNVTRVTASNRKNGITRKNASRRTSKQTKNGRTTAHH